MKRYKFQIIEVEDSRNGDWVPAYEVEALIHEGFVEGYDNGYEDGYVKGHRDGFRERMTGVAETGLANETPFA